MNYLIEFWVIIVSVLMGWLLGQTTVGPALSLIRGEAGYILVGRGRIGRLNGIRARLYGLGMVLIMAAFCVGVYALLIPNDYFAQKSYRFILTGALVLLGLFKGLKDGYKDYLKNLKI